ncbi:tetratricopeptide repeat protein 21B-like protein [Dinothrombium tinctorium]|uniref:Tetratricopeptide repeat protein 21B-like protein n=1 Tax=Dinothrombium tinctorium TaxID=1965070 RepID=A0A443QHL8_9ACAR|nr:tetratricopeptide repeat protein 21B-like protein [Dinothrombium tinctorium]
MSERDTYLRATIHYYCFNGFYRSMQNAALEGIRIFPGDEKYRFYYGLSLIFEGRFQESIRELESICDNKDFSFASTLALIFSHKKSKNIEKDEVTKLESKLKSVGKNPSEASLYFAALFALFIKNYESAKENIEKILKTMPYFKEALILKGWYKVLSEEENSETSSPFTFLDEAVKANDPEAILCKAKYFEKNAAFLYGVETLNQTIVSSPSFIPPFIEKMKLLVPLKDWDQVIDCANRVLILDRHCIEAKRYLIFHSLAWVGTEEEALTKLADFISSMELREPKNAELFYQTGKLFSRLANGSKEILNYTLTLTERATFLQQNNADYHCELGYQSILMGKLNDAQRHYKNASKADEMNNKGMIGVLYCGLLENDVSVSDQLEALEEFQKRTSTDILFLYLCALNNDKQRKGSKAILPYLDKIVVHQWEQLRKLKLGFQYYLSLEPELMMNVVKLYLKYGPIEPLKQGQPLPNSIIQAKEILQPIVTACPNLKEPLYLMAKLNYLSGDSNAALCLLQKCLDHNASFSDGYLLKAKILITQKNYRTAAQALENALSYNFQVRENLEYILVKVAILKHESKYEEALKILKSALSNINPRRKTSENPNDKITLTLELVDIYTLLFQSAEASKLLQSLLDEHKGAPEESRILIGSANLAESKGDIDEALSLLRSIKVDHEENFIKSREKMAAIYLKYRRDRRLYAACFREILDKFPQIPSYLMLGDAYMNILEPEKAIEIYEQALKKNPKNGALIRKVGEALVKTHQFEKVQLNTQQKSTAITTLQKALSIHSKIMRRINIERPDSLTEQKTMAVEICSQLADQLVNYSKDYKQALNVYREALNYDENNMKILMALADLEMITSNFDEAQRYCNSILKLAPDDDQSLLMMADLMFRKNDFEGSMLHFQQILDSNPNNYSALRKFIETARRVGNLDSAAAYLEKAENHSPRCKQESGFNYCKGLYSWHTGHTNAALICLNRARSDPELKVGATYHMVEICINPDNETIGGETFESIEVNLNTSDKMDNKEASLKMATTLLKEIEDLISDDTEFQIMNCFILLARKSKTDADTALAALTKILNENPQKENIAALLGISTAFMILKQSQKARNHLKRVAKMPWNYSDAEYLEKCWLLLADIYIQSAKFDISSELLRKVLNYNRSCIKAYEYLGFIMEKEQNCKEAALNYDMAWKLTSRSNPVLGYKLAFNYMKAKRFVDAIDVAKEVLEKCPDYPKIRKEILDKSRQFIKC